MMENRKIVCINCPVGCSLDVIIDGDNIKVTGNTCRRGADYAVNELKDPKRTVTSTVKVNSGERLVAAVKTKTEISKNLIFELMKLINSVQVKAPVMVGDIIIKNALNTGVDVIATANVKRKES
jgi:CxxC motif-containing protein